MMNQTTKTTVPPYINQNEYKLLHPSKILATPFSLSSTHYKYTMTTVKEKTKVSHTTISYREKELKNLPK